jgi:hypothetical protein
MRSPSALSERSARTPRPPPDHQPTTRRSRAARVRTPLQRSPTTPDPGAGCSLTTTPPPATTEIHKIHRRDRLGGLVHEYQQARDVRRLPGTDTGAATRLVVWRWILRRPPPGLGASLPDTALVLDQPQGGRRGARAAESVGVVELDVVKGLVLRAGRAVGPAEAEPARPAAPAAVGE